MNVPLIVIFNFFLFCDCAIIKENDVLETFKRDVTEVGIAVENFTFDMLRQILGDSEENEIEETTTQVSGRVRRSAEDDVRQLCQKRCDAARKAESKQINDLKKEVKKLQEIVKLLQEQNKIIDILDEDKENATKQTRAEESEDLTNSEQLEKLKKDVTNVIKDLNATKELLDLQKRKDEILEEELLKQNEEISKLKTTVAAILLDGSNKTEENRDSTLRASQSSTLKKLLKSLPNDDEDNEDDDDINKKLLQIQKELKKKRRQESLFRELKELEKSIDDGNSGDSDLMKQIIKAMKKTEPQGKSDNIDINNLEDLQDAINKLRPKEDDATQFQAMLNKLINNNKPTNPTPQITSDIIKKLTPSNSETNPPYICIVKNSDIRAPPYNNVNNNNYRPYYAPIPDYSNQKMPQFFPGGAAPQNSYPPVAFNGPNFEKPGYYQGENGDASQKYQDDLRQQIDGLQSAIDGMNKPEYLQKPEDKAIVQDLEKQISDLRSVVNNLNYNGSYQKRKKRSLENNEVEDNEEMIKKMSNIVGKILENNDNSKKTELADIQYKIDNIKKQLDKTAPKARDANDYYQPPPLPQLYSDEIFNPSERSLKSSFKNDFFVEIVGKILDKIISAIPTVIQKLFNFSFQELGKYDNKDYDVQVLFKNLGIFGFLPVILLRILKGITVFMNMLRKNSFFKNFLMPAIILGTVAGSILFLIWWLQPDDQSYGYGNNNYVTYDPGYSQNGYSAPTQNQYPVSYSNPVYNKNYYSTK